MDAVQPTANIPWGELGIALTVIVSLFGLVSVLVKWLIGHMDTMQKQHAEERKQWRTEDVAVRRETTDAFKEITRTHADAVKANTDEIKNLSTEVLRRIHARDG